MTSKTSDLTGPPPGLAEWLRVARTHNQCHSIALTASPSTDLHRIATAITNYLSEFDGKGSHQWRAFSLEELRTLADSAVCRDLILSEAKTLSHRSPPPSNLDRIYRRLARIGGVVLEGECGIEATSDITEVFHVCLCQDKHPAHQDYHLWINPELFAPKSLATVIADSFLNWSSHPGSSAQGSL